MACNDDNKNSNEVSDQGDIYTEYEIRVDKDSDKAKAKVTFYDRKETNDWNRTTVSLRQNSEIIFENNRMQEVRGTFGDNIHYEDTLRLGRILKASDTFNFEYLNNDDQLFKNKVLLPSFVRIIPNSIKTRRKKDKMYVTFRWEYTQKSPAGRKAEVTISASSNAPSTSFFHYETVYKNPMTIVLDEWSDQRSLNNLQLCTKLTQKAKGQGSKNKKTSEYCDSSIYL